MMYISQGEIIEHVSRKKIIIIKKKIRRLIGQRVPKTYFKMNPPKCILSTEGQYS